MNQRQEEQLESYMKLYDKEVAIIPWIVSVIGLFSIAAILFS